MLLSTCEFHRPVFDVAEVGVLERDITVQAESSADARRTVMDMVPNAVVTGVNRVEQPCSNPNFSHQPSGDYCNNACCP